MPVELCCASETLYNFSVLNRVLEPTILAEMVLSNNQVHNFEVSYGNFMQLSGNYRVNTCMML